MGKYKIEYERPGCIGAAACCAVCPQHFVMADDGKADLINSIKKPGVEPEVWEKEFEENEFEDMKNAAEACPVKVIHIINKETGEKII